MNRAPKMAGWLVSRCAADAAQTALPALVRDRIRRVFEDLTAPQYEQSPRSKARRVAPTFQWGLCDVYVNGRASAAICAVMGEVAIPVFVVPVASTVLHNGRGDAIRVRPNWLLSTDAPDPSNGVWPRACPCNSAIGGPMVKPRKSRGRK